MTIKEFQQYGVNIGDTIVCVCNSSGLNRIIHVTQFIYSIDLNNDLLFGDWSYDDGGYTYSSAKQTKQIGQMLISEIVSLEIIMYDLGL